MRKNRIILIITLMIVFAITGLVGCKYQMGGLMVVSAVSIVMAFYYSMEDDL